MLISWLITSVAIAIAAYLLPGVMVADVPAALITALVLGFLNAIVRPILIFLTLPITLVTVGLFTFVINASMVMLAAKIVPGFSVTSFWWALGFSLVVSIVASILENMVATDSVA